jgi:uracil-DNA glycosylase family 4
MFRTGFANQPTATSRDDGLRLIDLYVSAVNRCAPPANKPTPVERDNCLPFLQREIEALEHLRVIIALGSFAWDGVLRALTALGNDIGKPKPKFGHGVSAAIGSYALVGSFHPSQQNTFTGKLTPAMLDAVFEGVRVGL